MWQGPQSSGEVLGLDSFSARSFPSPSCFSLSPPLPPPCPRGGGRRCWKLPGSLCICPAEAEAARSRSSANAKWAGSVLQLSRITGVILPWVVNGGADRHPSSGGMQGRRRASPTTLVPLVISGHLCPCCWWWQFTGGISSNAPRTQPPGKETVVLKFRDKDLEALQGGKVNERGLWRRRI